MTRIDNGYDWKLHDKLVGSWKVDRPNPNDFTVEHHISYRLRKSKCKETGKQLRTHIYRFRVKAEGILYEANLVITDLARKNGKQFFATTPYYPVGIPLLLITLNEMKDKIESVENITRVTAGAPIHSLRSIREAKEPCTKNSNKSDESN